MKYFPFLFLAFSALAVRAQTNLVPNPSFEDTVQCPHNGRLYNCEHWINCRETPDFNYACVSPNSYGVPQNVFGYQPAATGNGYADVCTYTIGQLYREFISVSLTQDMVIGHTYDVSFKCAPGTINGYCLKNNKIGIRFSTIPFDSANPAPIDNFAHIYSNDVVTDTSNWTLVNGSFTADSAYNFLVIGNFFDDLNTDTVDPGTFCWFAVYYIDDVLVLDSTNSITSISNTAPQIVIENGTILIISEESVQAISVINSIGQLCLQSYEPAFSSSLFPPGIYFIKTVTKKQTHITKCFIN